MGSHHPIRKTVPAATPEIPDKLYFRIGDVARLCEVPAYVLRFWETEFPQLKPNKGGTGQRLYRKRDVEMALRIKSLLYDQGYTIPGARQVFKSEARPAEAALAEPIVRTPTPGPVPLTEREGPPGAAEDAGAKLRREAQLKALRDELRALADQLARPLNAPHALPTLPGKPMMRARLTLEPRPAKAEPASRFPVNQGDLFPAD